MENKTFVSGEQPPPYDDKLQPMGQPQPQAYPQPQPQAYPQPYPQPQPQPYGGGYGYQPPQPQAGGSTQSSNTVVVVAPGSQTMTVQEPVQDNMVISIISIFFCCLLGIVATIKASDSKEALKQGNVTKAHRDSTNARKLAIAAIVIGCVIGALSILFSIILPLILAASVSSSISDFDEDFRV